MAELTQEMIDAGATFFDANGVPTKPDGTPIAGYGWGEPGILPELQAQLLGHSGEGGREQAGTSLLNALSSQDFPDAPAVPNFHPAMTGAAQSVMDRQNFPVDPNRIVYDGAGGFRLDSWQGQDLFGGQLKSIPLSGIPRSLQALLGPSVAQFYANTQAQGWAPGWSGFFAPSAPVHSPEEKTWPGATYFDAWRRPIGMIQNFSS